MLVLVHHLLLLFIFMLLLFLFILLLPLVIALKRPEISFNRFQKLLATTGAETMAKQSRGHFQIRCWSPLKPNKLLGSGQIIQIVGLPCAIIKWLRGELRLGLEVWVSWWPMDWDLRKSALWFAQAAGPPLWSRWKSVKTWNYWIARSTFARGRHQVTWKSGETPALAWDMRL